MPAIQARLHVPGQTRLPLSVELDIIDEKVMVRTGDQTLAEWPLGEIEISPQTDGLHIVADNEEIVLNTAEMSLLINQLGLSPTPAMAKVKANVTVGSRDRQAMLDTLHEELCDRVDLVAESMEDESVPPPSAFGMWLKLLRELNHRHGHGVVPTDLFYEMNSRLLEMIPVPKLEAVD